MNTSQLCHYSPVDDLSAFKIGHLELVEKKKSHTKQDQVNREVVQVGQCSFMPGSAACSGRCEQVHCRGEPATICPATTHVSSHAPSEGNATGSLCRLADGLSGTVARTQCLLHQRILVLLLFRQTLYLYLSKILRLCYCNCLHHLHGCNCHPHHYYHIHILKPFIYSMGVDSSKSMPLHISVFNYFPSPSFYSPC